VITAVASVALLLSIYGVGSPTAEAGQNQGAARITRTAPVVLTASSDDPRVINAAAECAKAIASKLGIRGYGAFMDAARGKNENAILGATIALQKKARRELWNNFVQIPICATLVADLYIHPTQAGEGDFGDVSSDFIGPWTGGITQKNPPIPPFSLNVAITRGKVGSTIAKGHYTGTDPCDVHWILLKATVSQLVVNEVVENGSCFNNIKVTLRFRNPNIGYGFENGNGQGVLHRV